MSDDEGAGGHYVTSGTTLLTLGAAALVLAVVIRFVIHLELRFIDPQAMGLLGLGFMALGGFMIHHGRALRAGRTS